jgi:hypothetical protein
MLALSLLTLREPHFWLRVLHPVFLWPVAESTTTNEIALSLPHPLARLSGNFCFK